MNMQKAVIRATQEDDPLGEDETRSKLEAYLSGLSVPSDEINNYVARLSAKNVPKIHRAAQELQMDEVEGLLEETRMEDPEGAEASQTVDQTEIWGVPRVLQYWAKIRRLVESRSVPRFQTVSTFVSQENEE